MVAPVRLVRKVGAPIGLIIGLGVITGLVIILISLHNPVGAIIGFVLSSVAISVVVLCYLWLDRWEPEPPRLLAFAFIWGASVAIVVAFVLELVIGGSQGFSAAVVAPVVEEGAKGSFLLIMLTGRRRRELNSLTDCLVYAGIAAAGFAWVEDINYLASGDSLTKTLITAGLRLLMGPFAHPLFTSMTAIGVYFSLRQRSTATKALCILAGYLGAIIMHGTWNGSIQFGFETHLFVYAVWLAPIFLVMIGVAIWSRHHEQRIIAAKLPGMVASGLISPNEATWLGSIRQRRKAISVANQIGGPAAGKAVNSFAAQVVELAFIRDRIDLGTTDPEVYQEQNEEAHAVYSARASAPVLQAMAAYRAQ